MLSSQKLWNSSQSVAYVELNFDVFFGVYENDVISKVVDSFLKDSIEFKTLFSFVIVDCLFFVFLFDLFLEVRLVEAHLWGLLGSDEADGRPFCRFETALLQIHV